MFNFTWQSLKLYSAIIKNMPSEDSEESSIIERMMKELLKKAPEGKRKRPSEGSPAGFYDYVREEGAWRRSGDIGGWRPSADGLHVIFTDISDKCLLCTALGRWWYEFAEVPYERIWPHIELCEGDECADRAYTVAVMCVHEGEVSDSRRFSGVIGLSELAGIVMELLLRCPYSSRRDVSKLKEVCPCL